MNLYETYENLYIYIKNTLFSLFWLLILQLVLK